MKHTLFHPFVEFFYFFLVLLFSMILMHPAGLAISLLSSAGCAVMLNGRKAVRFGLCCLLPMAVLVCIVNPLFNHRGMTILAYFPDGNPLTLESVLYGMAAACMLMAVMEWFFCFRAVMTSDKFLYLFGKLLPHFSLVLSMIFRLVPEFARQFKRVREAQRTIRETVDSGKNPDKRVMKKFRYAVEDVSIMISWSMEHGIETADSMKSRGYGLPGRSSFSLYRFGKKDAIMLGILALFGGYIAAGCVFQATKFIYYPSIYSWQSGVYPASVFCVYAILCLMPIVFDRKEALTWKRLQSKI